MDPTVDGATGNIGPHTYEKLFELLLRLHANSLWPAMHPGSLAFNAVPENAELADKYGIPVGVHNTKLEDAKGLLRAGVEGWLHTPVRGGDFVDDDVIRIVKDRIARNFHPSMWVTPGLQSAWMNSQGATPAWLDDPLLKATYSAAQIKEYWGDPLAKLTPEAAARAKKALADDGGNMMKLRAAGMKVVMGTDTGQTRFFIGYYTRMDQALTEVDKHLYKDGAGPIRYALLRDLKKVTVFSQPLP